MVFKGGTSLSKVWNLIQRFSEDIDLAIDRSLFGLEGDLTNKQVKKLRKEASLYVRDAICQSLKNEIVKLEIGKSCEVEAESDGEGDNTYPEPRKIHIRYNSLFDEKTSYLNQEVLLEIGSRSLIEPTEPSKVKSLITTNFPIDTSIVDSNITTTVPQKTFLEKAFLIHELFSTGEGKIADRKSRHLYDLEKMMDENFARKAIMDDELWNNIHHHRVIFTHMKNVDYTPDIRDRICLVPPEKIIDEWRRDYEAMQSTMIYGKSLDFDKLMERICTLEKIFHNRSTQLLYK